MFGTIEIPVWLAVCAGLLGLAGLLDRIIGPSIRWMFRKRVNRTIDRVNQRLALKIQPFKLTKRKVLIDRLVYDPQVMEAMDDYVREEGVPREVALEKVEQYARETVPAFSAFAYFAFGARVARWISQGLYRVRLGFIDEDALAKVDPTATVVFVMNHRSNVDYLLVTYLAAERSALSYAVGEWARVWGLQSLIRSMGAYFIRRKSRNALYRKVLARYVAMATEGGVTQAVFPEGGLSRDGTLQPLKLGLLAYMTEGFEPGVSRDVVFIPVGLNYDRVLEDRILTDKGETEGSRRFKVRPWEALAFTGRLTWRRITGRMHKFGYACVSFGKPLSLSEFMAGQSEAGDLAPLGDELLRRVGNVIPVLPVSLIATVLLEADAALSPLELKSRTLALLHRLVAAGAHAHIPRGDDDYAVEVGLRMLRLRRLILEDDGMISVNPDDAHILRYYANAIAHLER